MSSSPFDGNLSNSSQSSFVSGVAGSGGPSGPASLPRVRGVQVGEAAPPALPSRNYRGYSRFGGGMPSMYGGYGGAYSSGYGYGMGMGGYSGMYGNFGGGYGAGNYGDNRYISLAEESVAPAFESIESFVRGFSSVTMMLESTYQAMQMSFRAVLGVVDNMSRMKSTIFEFLSALSFLRTIYYFYRRILHFLGLVNPADVSWREAERSIVDGGVASAGATGTTRWPMLTFIGVIIAAPVLAYKFLFPLGLPDDEEVELVGCFDFVAQQPGEMSFTKGEKMFARRSLIKNAWILARKAGAKGYIPYNRVKMMSIVKPPS